MKFGNQLKRVALVCIFLLMVILFNFIPINEQALAIAYKKMTNWIEFAIKASIISLLLGVLFELILLYPYEKYVFKVNTKLVLALVLIVIGFIPSVYWHSLLIKAPSIFKWLIIPLSSNKTQVVINVFAGILLAKSLVSEKPKIQAR